MKILFSIYFKYSDDLLLQVFNLIKTNKIGFEIGSITIDEDYDYDKGVELLNLLNKDVFFRSSIIVTDNVSQNSLMIFLKKESENILHLSFKYDSLERYLQNEAFFVNNLLIKNSSSFLIAYADNYEFTLKEDESDLQTYELLYGAVPESKIKIDIDGYEYIDVSLNHGRTIFLEGMGFKVSWRMYFGKVFYEKFNLKNLLENYKSSLKNKYLSNDIIYIELYDTPTQSDENKNYLATVGVPNDGL